MSSKTYLNLVSCLTLCLLAIGLAMFLPARLDGDGWEYSLVTEAILSHQSFDVRVEDIDSHEEYANLTSPGFSGLRTGIEAGDQWSYGFFRNKNDEYHSYHFVLFSLVNAPTKFLLKKAGFPTDRHFQITNAFLVCVLLVYVLLYSTQSEVYKYSVLLSVLLCGGFYYFTFSHPEVFVVVCMIMAFTAMLDGRYVQGMCLGAIMGMINTSFVPTVAMIGLFDVLHRYNLARETGYKPIVARTLLPYTVVVVLTVLPFAYNLAVFEKLSPLSGAVNFGNINPTRFYSFFFDLSQGMIVEYGPVLPMVFVLALNRIVQSSREFPRTINSIIEQRGTLLLFVPFLYSVPLMTQINWNSGMIYVMRYAFMAGIPFLLWIGREWTHVSPKLQATLAVPALCILVSWNVYPALIKGGIERSEYAFPYQARVVLERWPALYNPDPDIFADRMKTTLESRTIHFKKENGDITKTMLRREVFDASIFFNLHNNSRITADDVWFHTYPTWGEWGYMTGPLVEGYRWNESLKPRRNFSYPSILRNGWSIEKNSAHTKTNLDQPNSELQFFVEPVDVDVEFTMEMQYQLLNTVDFDLYVDGDKLGTWTIEPKVRWAWKTLS